MSSRVEILPGSVIPLGMSWSFTVQVALGGEPILVLKAEAAFPKATDAKSAMGEIVGLMNSMRNK